jgi:hypothetical protein
VFSLLAVKPQFALAVLLWLLVRRDGRAIVGLVLGGAIQVVAVILALGPNVLLAYVQAVPQIGRFIKIVVFSASFEQSFAGMAAQLLYGLGFYEMAFSPRLMLIQLAVIGLTGYLLYRVIQTRRRLPPATAREDGAWRYEYSAAVLFFLLFPPYLLVYDLTLLVIPLACLWSTPRWRMGLVLYALVTLPAAIGAAYLGVSLTACFLILAMCRALAGLQAMGDPQCALVR